MRTLSFLACGLSAASPPPQLGACVCTPRGQDVYGSYCASWDAADEKPWCAVRSAACGEDDTFESKKGLYWAHRACAGMSATPPKPADRSARPGTGSDGGSGGGGGGGSSSSSSSSSSGGGDGGGGDGCPYSDAYVASLFARAPATVSRRALRAEYERLHAMESPMQEYSLVTIRGGKIVSGGDADVTYGGRKSALTETIRAILAADPAAIPDMSFLLNSFDTTVDVGRPDGKCAEPTGLGNPYHGCAFPVEAVPVFATCADSLCKLDVPIPLEVPGFHRTGGGGGAYNLYRWPMANGLPTNEAHTPGMAAARKELPPWAARKATAAWRGTARYYSPKACPTRELVIKPLQAAKKAAHGAGQQQQQQQQQRRGEEEDAFDRRYPRYNLRLAAKARPELIDAEFTGTLVGQETARQIAKRFPARKDAALGWKGQSAYKYLIAADGNSYATGFGGLLLLGSVVLRHESSMNLWFEGMLEDGVDYVQVKYDFSDLAEKVEWLRAHDAEARAIAEAGQRKAEALLSNAGTECYVKKLLNHFAAMLVD